MVLSIDGPEAVVEVAQLGVGPVDEVEDEGPALAALCQVARPGEIVLAHEGGDAGVVRDLRALPLPAPFVICVFT